MKLEFIKHLTVSESNPNFDKTSYSIGETIELPEKVAGSVIMSGFAKVVEEQEAPKPKKTRKRKTKEVKKLETKD